MLVWNPDLSVNVVEIDDQHKELFSRVNRFLEAMERCSLFGDKQGLALFELCDFMEQYVVFHFN